MGAYKRQRGCFIQNRCSYLLGAYFVRVPIIMILWYSRNKAEKFAMTLDHFLVRRHAWSGHKTNSATASAKCTERTLTPPFVLHWEKCVDA